MSVIGELFGIPDDDWVGQAVCAQTDPEIFHPVKGNSARPAKRICAGCPVRAECLEYALRHHDTGVWGGFSDRERGKLKRGHNPLRGPGRPHRRENGHGFNCRCVICRQAS